MINILHSAVELHAQVHIYALGEGSAALSDFWGTKVGGILHGGLYIAGTLSVIFAAFTSIRRFAKASDSLWTKIQPLLFAAVFATFCVQPQLANDLISAFTNGIGAIAATITSLTK